MLKQINDQEISGSQIWSVLCLKIQILSSQIQIFFTAFFWCYKRAIWLSFFVTDGLYGSEILNQQQKYIGQLEKWLGGTKSWKLCYRASDHGWAASAFHSRCDNKRPTVTIIRVGVKPAYIFGAYSDVAFGG